MKINNTINLTSTPTSLIRVTPVILAGGAGTRLWPLSRVGFPKQFHNLLGGDTLFQQSVTRVRDIAEDGLIVDQSIIVTNEDYRFIVLEQLRQIEELGPDLLLESVAKNTAPSLTLAALHANKNSDDPVLLVMSSDHYVRDNDQMTITLRSAVKIAAHGQIVVLGVRPVRPEVGFGYIRKEASEQKGVLGDFLVDGFIEKPSIEKAEEFLASGEYFWNSGIFILRASVWLDAIKKFRGDIFEKTLDSYNLLERDGSFVRPARGLFSLVPNESIDYAVMEKCIGSGFAVRVLELEAGWNDLGSWDAILRVGSHDSSGNVVSGDVVLDQCKNTLVKSTHRLVCAVGVRDLAIVETEDAILVSTLANSQGLKGFVNELHVSGREEAATHRKVYRPWGWYDTIDFGSEFKVKRISVNTGASLSLQRHIHRAEHWVVVKGTAEVTCGENVILLNENESTYIPMGQKHRLKNIGDDTMEIIEVQSGAYLSESDIERLDDSYGRIEHA